MSDYAEELGKADAIIQDLKAKLSQVEATAKRRLELLQNWKWPKDKCPWCGCGPAQLGHRPNCGLARELNTQSAT